MNTPAKIALTTSLTAAAAALSGCVIRHEVVYADPPRPPVREVYVDEAPPPPAPVREVVTVSPGPGYIWIDGCYEWSGAHYVWSRGHWAHPVHPGAVWVRGDWRHSRGHSVWVSGHWR